MKTQLKSWYPRIEKLVSKVISQDNKININKDYQHKKALNTHYKLNNITRKIKYYSQEKLIKANQILQEEYNTIENNILQSNIKQIEQSNEQCKHAESWRLINKITSRKNSNRGQIKAKSKEDLVNTWYENFKNLLWSNSNNSNNNKDYIHFNNIKTICGNNMNIEIGQFTLAEYIEVIERLIYGKAPVPDGITPAILKYCNLNKIILEFSNKMIIQQVIPKQWLTCNITPLPKSGISKK